MRNWEIINNWSFETLMSLLRYLTFAIFFQIVFYRKSEKKLYPKIQQRFPGKLIQRKEALLSLQSLSIYSFVAYFILLAKNQHLTRIYNSIDEYGYTYLILSVIIMIVLHDTYFYWSHRLLHTKVFFKRFHKTHHTFKNPSPWCAFSFHPLEAIVEIGILPLIVFLIPCHPLALGVFWIISTFITVYGHTGFEVFPKSFIKNKFWNINNSSTHHNMHHQHGKYNYGLYFNIWDKLMKTNNPAYIEYFEKITSKDSKNLHLQTSGSPES